MSYSIDNDDTHDIYELREKIRKLEAIVMDIHIPSFENLYNSGRHLIGYLFGNKTSSGFRGGTITTTIDNSKIKDYDTVLDVVTILQEFKSHKITLGGDITIQFDGTVDVENLKKLYLKL